MDRPGLSLSLNYMVVGVVVLTVAVTVIGLSTGVIQNVIGVIGGGVSDAQVRAECNSLMQEIDRNYCTKYVLPDCTDPQDGRDANHSETASTRDCPVTAYANADGLSVTVDGEPFDCVDEGYIPPSDACPAG